MSKDYSHDEAHRFFELAHYHMNKCGYRRNMDDVGVCSLYVLPCEKVFLTGQCEAVAKWLSNKSGEDE